MPGLVEDNATGWWSRQEWRYTVFGHTLKGIAGRIAAVGVTIGVLAARRHRNRKGAIA